MGKASLPARFRALVMARALDPAVRYHPTKLTLVDMPEQLGDEDVVVKMAAASLNHRDVWIRQLAYPGAMENVPLGADGVGRVVWAGESVQHLLGQRVMLRPSIGWAEDPRGPETPNEFAILGGTKQYQQGTFAQYIHVPSSVVVPCPQGLDVREAAALPLCGVTAYRALFTKGGIEPGQNVLITGAGGGVANIAIQFAVALGCRVYVTSGSQSKIDRAIRTMGCSGGVSYRDETWGKQLARQLPAERPYLDCVVDSGGGPILAQTVRMLKDGARVVVLGMTAVPKIEFTMQAVMKNIDLVGTMMGSNAEFDRMLEFVEQHGVRPNVCDVAHGLDKAEALFDKMKHGTDLWGKLVIVIDEDIMREDGSRL